MKITILFLLGVVSNVCTALYANPNYKSVVVSTFKRSRVAIKPHVVYTPAKYHTTYQVEQIHGLPKLKIPAISNGVPEKTIDFKSAVVVEARESTPVKPSKIYGAPAARIPSTSYGVPFQIVAVPQRPVRVYGVPTTRTLDFDFDDDDDNDSEEVVKPQKPAMTYGVPVSSDSTPVTEYRIPKARTPPAVVYGVPNKPSEEYGVPQVRIPATEYGLF